MAAQQFDFVSNPSGGGNPCEQGATFSQQVQWAVETPPGSCIQVPVNLTGYTAKMQVRRLHKTDPIIIELSTVNGRITLDAPNGNVNLLISASDTALLISGIYKYDLELTDASGFVTRLIQGDFEIVEQITV